MSGSVDMTYHPGSGGVLRISCEKGAKCPCGRKAHATMMSDSGKMELFPACWKCGALILEYRRLRENAEAADLARGPKALRDWCVLDSGVSSLTILEVLSEEMRPLAIALARRNLGAVPRDPGDFGRCHRLLALIPDGRSRLGEVAERHPDWRPLVENWEELTRLYEEELPSGQAPKLYARMKELGT